MLYNANRVATQEEFYSFRVLDRSTWNTHNAYVGKYTDTTIIRGLYRAEQAERLLAARKSVGLTQAAFAKELGVPPTTYASCEQGERGVGFDLAERLSKRFDVAVEWWLGTMSAKEAAMMGIERGHHGKIVEAGKASHDLHGHDASEKRKRK